MSKRRNKNSLPDSKDKRIAELEQPVQQLVLIVAKLQKENERLRAEVEELKRAGKRQAAPFARRHWVEHPKRPGRKAGQGRFVQRAKPSLKEVHETKEAELPCCPECGGKLRRRKTHEQYEVEQPKVEPLITRFLTHSSYCPQCRKRMRSWHPDQISHATGAAGRVVVGPRAKGLATDRLEASTGRLLRQSQ
jgi:hypothetical protein